MPTSNYPTQPGGLPETLNQAFFSKMVTDEHGNSVPLDSNVTLEEAQSLYSMVKALGATATAEVGLAKGISAMAICKALEDNDKGHHHIMDPFQEKYGNAGLAMLRHSQLDHRMTFHRKFAEEVFPSLPELDFAFIDASHLFDLTMVEFVLADKKLRMGGVIAFHDLWMSSLQKLLRFILANRAYRLSSPTRHSVGSQAAAPNESRWKRVAASILQRIPLTKRFLRPEVLVPWGTLNISNLVFIEKTGHDERDWRHFRNF
jgi:predicted O-methyltransferase YrrM